MQPTAPLYDPWNLLRHHYIGFQVSKRQHSYYPSFSNLHSVSRCDDVFLFIIGYVLQSMYASVHLGPSVHRPMCHFQVTKKKLIFRLGIISPYGVIRERNCNTTIIGWNHTFITCTFRKSKVAPTFYMAKCLFLLSK